MQFKKIVGFGDSWVWGDELLDPDLAAQDPTAHPCYTQNNHYRLGRCFLGLLGQHYGVPIENLAIPGGSQQSTIWNYLWWLDHTDTDPSDCLILVGLTGNRRHTFYNPRQPMIENCPDWDKYVHTAWLEAEDYHPDWKTMVKQHAVLTDCPQWRYLNYAQAVRFFHGQPNTYQFSTYEVVGRPIAVSSLFWPNSSLDQEIKQRTRPGEAFAANLHPNELGHQIIADLLISQLDSCKITGC